MNLKIPALERGTRAYHLHRLVLVPLGLIIICKNWLLVFLHLAFKTPLRTVQLRNGVVLKPLRSMHRTEFSILSEVWYERVYDPPLFEINDTDIVFDIGSNTGIFALYAGLQAKHVYAFEPVPYLAEQIKHNLRVNNLSNVEVMQLAITGKPGHIAFHFSQINTGAHSAYSNLESPETIEVQTTSIEDFCNKKQIDKIDLFKMDCEGSEYEILLNMRPEMLRRISKIAMEFHYINGHSPAELVNYLESSGFKCDMRKNLYLYALRLG